MKDEADKLFEQCVRLQKELNLEKEKVKQLSEALETIKNIIFHYPGEVNDVPLLPTIESIAYYAIERLPK